MTAKTARFRASKQPLVGKYGELICGVFERLLNALKGGFWGVAEKYENAK
jgi:hypothetical protein